MQDGFSILFPETDTVRLFREKLKLSQITAVPQEHRRLQIILTLLEKINEGTTSVNETTVRESALESMQFGSASPRILQAIWEADLIQRLFRVSQLDVTDAYHRSTLRTAQMGALAYVIAAAT